MTHKFHKLSALLTAGVILAVSAFAKESDHGDGGRNQQCAPKPPPTAVTIVAPVTGTSVTPGPASVTVTYTAQQAGSVITLFEGTAAVGTFTVPSTATSGTATFAVDLSLVPSGATVTFQAKMCPPSRCGDGRDGGDSRDRSRVLSSDHHDGGHDDGDDEDDDGGSSSCVSSNIVSILVLTAPNTGNT